MKAKEFKEYLLEDIQRVEILLEAVGCHSIWRTGDEIRCAPPDGTDHTKIAVNMDTLYSNYYGDLPFRGDVLALVQHLRNEEFGSAMRFAKGIFGIKGGFDKTDNKIDILSGFKAIRKQHKAIKTLDEIDVPKFGMETLREFVTLPHLSLFYEGITPQTQELFKVSYDPVQDRIVFPHFAYDDIDAIVGLTGRTLKSDIERKEFRIPKYFNYIKGYKKMYNLYGFAHSLQFVERDGILFLFEGEKSTQKQFSMTRNEGTSASTGGHELSEQQVQIILRHTKPDTEIVIAYDKDVMTMLHKDTKEHIGEQFLVDTCNMLSKYRKTSYVYDSYNILGEKDAPVDKGVKIWNHLVKYRKKV